MTCKNALLSLFLTLSFSGIFAQESLINQYDADGRKTGIWESYYESGKIKSRGTFLMGHPVGELLKYYPGGILQTSMYFDESGRTSYVKMFYETGKIAAEGKYINQQKDSTWNYYSTWDHRKAVSETFLAGKKHGQSLKYYQGEKPSEYLEWQNDQRNGKWEQYYENGQVRLTGTYIADLLNGDFISYNADGSLSITGSYMGGSMDGIWTYYNDQGELELTVEYNKGRMLPNPEMDKRLEEFSKKVLEVSGNPDETEFPELE